MQKITIQLKDYIYKRNPIILKNTIVHLLLSALTGILLSLSYPLTDFYLFAWISFVPLLLTINGLSLKRSFVYSFFSGIVFWLTTAFWMKTFHELSLISVIPYLALYFTVPVLLTSYWKRVTKNKFPALTPLIFAITWTGLEYFRCIGFLGFPWGLVGYSQYKLLPVIQIVDVTGIWGITFLVIFINANISEIIIKSLNTGFNKKIIKKYILPSLIIISIVFTYGLIRLNETKPKKTFRVALVQAFTDPAVDWSDYETTFKTIRKIEKLSTRATNHNVDIIIWSETLMARKAMFYHRFYKSFDTNSFYYKIADWFTKLPKKLKTDMLLTSPDKNLISYKDRNNIVRKKWATFNSAFYFDSSGKLRAEYRKIHLVPFGEWFPYKNLFPWIARILTKTSASNFTGGRKFIVFNTGKAKFATMICFEDIFGNLCRLFIKKGAEFLINTTNDYWSKSIKSQVQHFAMAVFRAIENRRYMVRAANTGVTSIIDPWGRIEKRLPDNKVDILVGDIALMKNKGLSIYTKLGDYLGILFFVISIILASIGTIYYLKDINIFNIKGRFTKKELLKSLKLPLLIMLVLLFFLFTSIFSVLEILICIILLVLDVTVITIQILKRLRYLNIPLKFILKVFIPFYNFYFFYKLMSDDNSN